MLFASSLMDGCSRAWLCRFAMQKTFFTSIMNGDYPPSYVTDNGGNVGGKNGGVPSLSPALSQVLSQVLSQDEEKDASIDAKVKKKA